MKMYDVYKNGTMIGYVWAWNAVEAIRHYAGPQYGYGWKALKVAE